MLSFGLWLSVAHAEFWVQQDRDGLHPVGAASVSVWKAASARSTPGWLNSPRLSARSGKGDALGALQGRRQ